ncbi:hypothetical protein AB0J80_37845 [Actinoplanes sp. NPDC049548]|uniref:hypothetical protein n=1 Tax=Actinoplanes sp. NPDC049548 TaxID=3155152 RepID=UPI0034469C25
MSVEYRYFGILTGDRTPDRPAGVIRTWTDEDGRTQEETFRSTLTWAPSNRLSPSARPDYDEIVEIDESVVEQFVERIRQRYRGR